VSTTYVTDVPLTTIHCGRCAGTYAIDERYRTQCEHEGRMWHCPYCEIGWGYNEGENARLKRELTEAKSLALRRQQETEQARAEAEHFRKSRDTIKGLAKVARIRVGRGVCPCCNRTFAQLANHMSQKHPGYVKQDEQP